MEGDRIRRMIDDDDDATHNNKNNYNFAYEILVSWKRKTKQITMITAAAAIDRMDFK